VFQTKVYELPQSSRQAKGQALVNIIQIGQLEKVTSLITLSQAERAKYQYFFFATSLGHVKKSLISDYKNVRKTGLIAINLQGKDELRWVKMTTGNDRIIEVSSLGQAIYYLESDVRQMGRSAAGVRGMKLRPGDQVMAADVVHWPKEPNAKAPNPDLLLVLENGFGKRTGLHHFTQQQRGGIGMRAAHCTDRTGQIIGMYVVDNDSFDVLLMSQQGQTLRTKLSTVKRLGRDTQGVTLMKLPKIDKVASVTMLESDVDESETSGKAPNTSKKPTQDVTKKTVTKKLVPVKKTPTSKPASTTKPAAKKPTDNEYQVHDYNKGT
jgi:DNA gyrase subunit A